MPSIVVRKPSPKRSKANVRKMSVRFKLPGHTGPDPEGRRQRSKITNGSSLLPGVFDQRSPWIRRTKDLISLHMNDLANDCSEAEKSLIRRIAVLTVQLETIEAGFAAAASKGEKVKDAEVDLYIRGSGNLRRLLQTIGIHRRARDVTPTPSVDDYFKHKTKLREAAA